MVCRWSLSTGNVRYQYGFHSWTGGSGEAGRQTEKYASLPVKLLTLNLEPSLCFNKKYFIAAQTLTQERWFLWFSVFESYSNSSMTLTFFPTDPIENVTVWNFAINHGRKKARYTNELFVTSDVNNYFCRLPRQNSPSENIAKKVMYTFYIISLLWFIAY